jgi:lipopolysaccharide transport system ATP-binding protein
MSDIAIKFENISKQYRLGLVSTQTLSHDLNRWWQTAVLRREDPYLKIGEINDRATKGTSDYVWALRDINFDVKQGDVLGIIGKNGAGKSTLLKILSKVTAPTTGSIQAKGRIASLLEVGTGFHPEMTGRENIYLNGAILGMTKAEITKKLDEIVDFSGVERYLDTPVKRYSSGMTVRLAFAIAAHLDPEILVVDEVLAVGDAEFQKKAIGKMQDVSKGGGRTVLFVSHNMGTILQLCENTLLLKDGKIDDFGISSRIIEKYYNESRNVTLERSDLNSPIYVKELYTCNMAGKKTSKFAFSEKICLRMTIAINQYDPIQTIGVVLLSNDKKRIFTVAKPLSEFYNPGMKEVTVDFIIQDSLIAPMDYSFLVALNAQKGLITYDWLEDVCDIKIYDDGTDFAFAEGINYGYIMLKDEWRIV